MMDVMPNNGTKIRRYMEAHGQDKVETFIDRVLSLDDLLDVNVLFNNREKQVHRNHEEEYDETEGQSEALRSFIRSQKRYDESKSENIEKVEDEPKLKVDESLPSRDIMGFLMDNAPIEDWQADIIGLLREEAYYFLPQRMTKIMNEGWASYWHSKIMTKHALDASEIIDFADHHAGVMAVSRQQINPYKIGIELFRDIEYRWNTGRFGKEYLECEDMNKKANWMIETNLGREKIFEVRKTHNDITFIDEFFTQEFCERQQLFTYQFNPRTNQYEISERDFKAVKEKLLSSLTNFGTPVIEVVDSNYQNRGELLLRHVHRGVDLDYNHACETLRNIFYIWKRPIHIETVVEDGGMIISHDGKR